MLRRIRTDLLCLRQQRSHTVLDKLTYFIRAFFAGKESLCFLLNDRKDSLISMDRPVDIFDGITVLRCHFF